MSDVINLISLIQNSPGKRLHGVDVFGKISYIVDKPKALDGSTQVSGEGNFYKLQIFAVRLPKTISKALVRNSLELSNVDTLPTDRIFFVRGDICVFLPKGTPYGELVSISGSLGISWLYLGGRPSKAFISMFRFSRVGSGWGVSTYTPHDIDLDSWDKEGRPYAYIKESDSAGVLIQPPEVVKITAIAEAEGYETPPTKYGQDANVVKTQQGDQSPTEDQLTASSVEIESYTRTDTSGGAVTSIADFKIEDRLKPKPQSNTYRHVKKLLDRVTTRLEKFVKSLGRKYEDSDDSKYLETVKTVFYNICVYWKSKPTGYASTGRSIIKNYITRSGEDLTDIDDNTSAVDFILDNFDEVYNYMFSDDGSALIDSVPRAESAVSVLFGNVHKAFAGVLASMVGVSVSALQGVANACKTKELSFLDIVFTNPYILMLLDLSLGFRDVDTIAHSLGVDNTQTVTPMKNVCILLENTMNSDTGSTLFEVNKVINSLIGQTLTNREFWLAQKQGTYLKPEICDNIRAYFPTSITSNRDLHVLPTSGWVSSGRGKTKPLTQAQIKTAMTHMRNWGLGVAFSYEGVQYITDTRTFSKELYVYEKVYELVKKGGLKVSDEEIKRCIDDFEQRKGFKLEDKQAKAGYLVREGVALVTGPAGSGKTTVSECIVDILKSVKEDIVIQYAAPTGKAAKRLQEVVGGNVKTMHSMFRVFGTDSSLLADDEDAYVDASEQADVYIFDENAMVTIDLLYSVLTKITHGQIFFLGDIQQLPPIGKGLPFKNMLEFMPCVELNVTKRAAEGSKITLNSDIINNYSGRDNWKPLVDDGDFRIVECADDAIQSKVYDICRYYLGDKSITKDDLISTLGLPFEKGLMDLEGLDPDDIQVVTPVNKSTYSWGAHSLNLKLQDLFNPRRGSVILYNPSGRGEGTEFRIGDRVLHNSNSYTLRHYSSFIGGKLRKTGRSGVMNGDVGKIVGVLHSKDCEFLESQDEEDVDVTESKREIRKDEDYIGDNMYFVIVKYYDINTSSDYFILYHAPINKEVTTEFEFVFGGIDLSNLQLSYALTVHKMQGSQGRLIICALGAVNFRGFLTRNLIYTAITRASDLCFIVGNVGNDRGSALSQARTESAQKGVLTVMDSLK